MSQQAGREPIYDAHAHVFTNDAARYPMDTRNAREGEDNLRRRIAAEPITAERLWQWWEASGVVAGAAVQYNTIYKTDNRYLLDATYAHPDKLSAVVILDAQDPETPAQLTRMVIERGIVGLRLFGYPDATGAYPWLDSEAALRTWAVADRFGLTMVVMYAPGVASPAPLARVGSLARRFPRLRIALDHFGWPGGGDPQQLGLVPVLEAMRKHRNVYYKLTTINFRMFDQAGVDHAAFVRRAVDVMGADHVMWGSDVGNTQESYESMAAQARASAALLDETERRLFLCDTARSLFQRGDR
ncbi:amidohydrolase family protein [Nitrospirillum sp. BR 11163]|uniref:amidohydrolase family protein n=1 Tax=Nitrospirillum sp. BR 11163 TaxID=3104323 RepID=UPI002AFF2AC9|nr:amidohydrolase family protein [Nitrospirillum sp. BR 11163]MEA1672756.1 amidohydrolase family protein [Nitrospirillum sp. BR 11163]